MIRTSVLLDAGKAGGREELENLDQQSSPIALCPTMMESKTSVHFPQKWLKIKECPALLTVVDALLFCLHSSVYDHF